MAGDTGLQETVNLGTLGPGSDIESAKSRSGQPRNLGAKSFAAIALGVFLAVLVGSVGTARAAWEHFADLFTPHSTTAISASGLGSAKYRHQMDRLPAQQQAESLLELAIGNAAGANEEIKDHVDHWRGKLKHDSQLTALITAALNANDLAVRESGIEVQLAAYGLAKNSSTVDVLFQEAASAGHAQKIWALWSLGALANRGVQTEQVEQFLVSHLKDADEDSRSWAVEALAMVGTTTSVAPLLTTMHNDASPNVRERAACSLAESGMLSHEQRLTAVPQLVNYTEDPALDAQTHAWAFQALGDITRQRLPQDSVAWRNWYAAEKGE